jgi:predicted dienelactone hydrolase
MTRRFLTVTFAALALFGCATTDRPGEEDDTPRSRYGTEAGETPVGVIPNANLRDAQGSLVTMAIDYPTRGCPCPLILFSHGYGGGARGYVGLATHWASYGYVVIRANHRDTARIGELTAANWQARVDDIRFILDSLPALIEKYPELQGRIDTEKIGLGGHSLGALTAMLMGGVRTYPGAATYNDPRIDAVIAMSPQGPREAWGLTEQSYAALRTPTLFMTGTLDRGLSDEETPEWRARAFELAPAGDKWLFVIQNAGHASFTGATGLTDREQAQVETSPAFPTGTTRTNPAGDMSRQRTAIMVHPERALHGTVKALSLAFWDAYLRSDAKGRETLESAQGRGNVEVKKK